jgi:uncharacterized protein DUF4446
VSNLSTTAGVVAIAGVVIGLASLAIAVVLIMSIRRLRAAQRVILGDTEADLIEHAAVLQESFSKLAAWTERTAERLDGRVTSVEGRLDGAIAHSALVRYDAYGEMSGQQSLTIALLDSQRSGVVISSIHHRDSARVYAKQVSAGVPELELSPEEADAVRLALSDK